MSGSAPLTLERTAATRTTDPLPLPVVTAACVRDCLNRSDGPRERWLEAVTRALSPDETELLATGRLRPACRPEHLCRQRHNPSSVVRPVMLRTALMDRV